jgi:mannosylglycoprotein endo-beta-mannosidase
MLQSGMFAPINLDNVYTDENLSLLPDMAVTGAEYYTYTYKNTAEVNCDDVKGTGDDDDGQWKLRLNGVNYRSVITVGGTELGHTVGMFSTHTFDVPSSAFATSGDVCSLNLEVLVSPPDQVGDASQGGQGGDHEIARNGPVTQFSVGWDWIQATPDRHTGIWDTVELFKVGTLSVTEPLVSADVEASSAVVQVNVAATGGGKVVAELVDAGGVVVATAATQVSKSTSASGDKVSIGPLVVPDLQLWWPHTLGEAYLYEVVISTEREEDGLREEALRFTYGFREVEGYIHEDTQGWAFKVNGQDVFLQGGNWITTDQLLRYATNAKRYHDEVSLHRDMGLNLLRVWGGGVTERQGFYDAADKLGMLVWQEFWMTGDNNGRWGGNYSFPDSDTTYLRNVRSSVVSLRTHPSLLMYCGGNELYPDHVNPKPTIGRGIQAILATEDPGRFFSPSSMAPQVTVEQDPEAWDPMFSFANDDGPYSLLMPAEFYKTRNPGLAGYENTPQSINPELGSVGTPEYESMQLFLSEDVLASFPTRLSTEVHPTWDYHKYESYTSVFDGQTTPDPIVTATDYDHIYDEFGGSVPADTPEYCWRAQVVMYEQFKSLFEGFSAHAWEWYAGVLFWKSQTPWPALRGGLYDYYLRQTGGFWGVRSALKDTVHIQLDGPRQSGLRIVNKGAVSLDGLRVSAKTYDLSGQVLVDVSADVPYAVGAASVLALPATILGNLWPVGEDSIEFVELALHQGDEVRSRNSYFSARDTNAARTQTARLQTTQVAQSQPSKDATAITASVTVTNAASGPVAFMARLTLMYADAEPGTDARVLPTHYTVNYATIVPGAQVHVDLAFALPTARPLRLRVDGFNVEESFIDVTV